MKNLIALFLIFSVFSCKKENTEQKIVSTDYFYKIVAFDIGTLSKTESWVETTKIVEVISSSHDDDDDDDQCYCRKHKDDKKCKSLPVLFNSFTLRKINNSTIELIWEVEEQSIKNYTILRSLDGINFKEVGQLWPVSNTGKNQYKFKDFIK